MDLTLRNARVEDLDRIFEIRVKALYDDIWTRVIYPQGRSEATLESSKRAWTVDISDPFTKFTVAVTRSTDQVVAFAKWTVIQHNRPELEWNAPYQTSSAGDEANDDAWQSLDRAKHEMRLRTIGGDPHIYLSFLCTHPSMQGRGAGGLLLKQVSDLADEKMLHCYLASTNAGHGLYLRRGFRDIDSFTLDMTRYGIPEIGRLDFMCRAPTKN